MRGSSVEKNGASNGFNSHVKAFVLLILMAYIQNLIHNSLTEAATQRCSYEKKF